MLTKKELIKKRKKNKALRQRSKWLSKKYGVKIGVLDLNPHATAGRKFPKSALTKSGKKIWDAGHANTRRKEIKKCEHRLLKNWDKTTCAENDEGRREELFRPDLS